MQAELADAVAMTTASAANVPPNFNISFLRFDFISYTSLFIINRNIISTKHFNTFIVKKLYYGMSGRVFGYEMTKSRILKNPAFVIRYSKLLYINTFT